MKTSAFVVSSMLHRLQAGIGSALVCASLLLTGGIVPSHGQERRTGGGTGTPAKPKPKPHGTSKPKDKLTAVTVATVPGACLVSVDGIVQGSTDGTGWLEIKVKPGNRTIQIERSGYRTEARVIPVSSGRSVRLPVTLSPLFGELSISTTPVGASITVSGLGRFQGPSMSQEVTPGSYEIEVSLDGYRSSTRRVDVDPGSKAHVDVTLEEVPHRELLDEADRKAAAGDHERAMSICRSVLVRRPKNERAMVLLGKSLYALGRYAESAGVFTSAMREGAVVPFEVKHAHVTRKDVTFCTGLMTVRLDAVEFRSLTSPGCSLSVARSSVRGSTFQAGIANRLVIRVASMSGRKETIVDSTYFPTSVTFQRSGYNCYSCDGSTVVLFQLLQSTGP